MQFHLQNISRIDGVHTIISNLKYTSAVGCITITGIFNGLILNRVQHWILTIQADTGYVVGCLLSFEYQHHHS